MQLTDVPTNERYIGRASIFWAPVWDGETDLFADLEHLGDTEGDVVFDPQASFVYLTTPELRGQAKLLGYEEGSDPVLDVPFYRGSPAMLAILSATASKHGGHTRRVPVDQHTLLVVPEELFWNASTKEYNGVDLIYNGAGDFQLDFGEGAAAFTAAQSRFFGLAHWIWGGHWISPTRTFAHTDAGKAVQTTRFQGMVNENLPNGHQLWTVGNPFTEGEIEVAGGS
jgi:hypothetical protein